MSDTALLVIDVQRSFEHMPCWNPREVPAWRERQRALVDVARTRGWPIAFVLHNGRSGPFRPSSGHVTLMDFVARRDDEPVFDKHVHNALTESGLEPWLRERGLSRLLISGIRTEQCCETTARVASDLGFDVEFVLDATLTFDMTHPLDGTLVDAASIRSRTALVLAERFARITHVADYTRTEAPAGDHR